MLFKTCPSCGNELAWRDNDNPLLNCVELCENAQCKSPHRVEYYEAPADVDVLRSSELWLECLGKVAGLSNVESGDLLKHSDALYLKRSK